MKYLLILALVGLSATTYTRAQEGTDQIVLTESYEASFGKVWAAMKNAMDVAACGKAQQEKVIEPAEEGGLYKGVYVSDYCLIAQGEDSSKIIMQQYGEVPPIRGGMWITGRVQYKINVKEESAKKVKIVLRAELSGFEEFITNKVYFWASNGILEKRMMDAIAANIKTILAAPASE